ncbi:hypothetical protein [Hymenobacter sp. 102]|uniref:hypothetical protein n=1 Tax=Hymenobacter sp. 102 TaxID=3403152 RepID=UPI003CF6DA91
MQISIERIIQEGDISPLKWGMSGEDIAQRLLHSYPLIQKYRQGNYPFLDLDGVELYFKEDFYLGLTQLIIQAWRIKPKRKSRFFDFGWLHHELTYDKVLRNLERLGWAFTKYVGYYKEPVLLVDNHALFHFYDIPEPNGTYVISKVVILHPQDTQLVIDQLGKLPYEMIHAS